MSAAKNWVFTINNFSETDEVKLETMFQHGHFSYIVYGREIGASGTPHLQGYVQLKKKVRMAQAKAFICGRAHMEVSRGSPDLASRYCKKDGDFTEFGTIIFKGGNNRTFGIIINPMFEWY